VADPYPLHKTRSFVCISKVPAALAVALFFIVVVNGYLPFFMTKQNKE
jgi:hypothetical protein